MPIKTSSAKNKGRELQKSIVKDILETFPELEEDDVVSRPMGSSGTDLLLSPKAQKLVQTSIEAKNTKAKPSSGELEQSKANAYSGTIPVVVWKPYKKGMDKKLVMLDWKDYLFLIRRLNENQSNESE